MLSIFSYASLPSVYILWRGVCLGLLPTFNQVVLLLLSFKCSLYTGRLRFIAVCFISASQLLRFFFFLQIEGLWQLRVVRWWLAFFSKEGFFLMKVCIAFLDIMLLYTYWTTVQCEHNFYMHQETKKFTWLTLLWLPGTKRAVSRRSICADKSIPEPEGSSRSAREAGCRAPGP